MNITKYTKWLSFLGLIGVGLAGYLTYLHFVPEASSICEFSESFSCDKVNKSTYSELFGIPVAVMGLLYYLAMFVFMALFSFKKKIFEKLDLKDIFRGILLITLIGIAFTLYLTYQEIFTLHAYCLFCVVQQIVILIMGGILFRAYKKLS
ncbi:vitamin K epoxide reductase family protein [Candidatus Peregrinibacteria bacterium]|jgi:uncharacterized membrane protein|nr:vitamin K epoxide reductase family protein [Candidatus Peregrinibacteria bacterium]